ncbi:MAG TPA: hypothetical protein VH855_25975 [Acetobacteraceae bacterium]|jgi:hypothetical protein
MRTFFIAVALAAVLVLPRSAKSQLSPIPPVADILSFALDPGRSNGDANSRIHLATLLSKYCAAVLNAVPRNTPGEDDWVSREMDTTDLARLARMDRSAEYSRWHLARTLNECVLYASRLTYGRPLPLVEEAKAWARLVMTFNSSGDTAIHATRLGLANSVADPYGLTLQGSIRYALTRAVMGTLDDMK